MFLVVAVAVAHSHKLMVHNNEHETHASKHIKSASHAEVQDKSACAMCRPFEGPCSCADVIKAKHQLDKLKHDVKNLEKQIHLKHKKPHHAEVHPHHAEHPSVAIHPDKSHPVVKQPIHRPHHPIPIVPIKPATQQPQPTPSSEKQPAPATPVEQPAAPVQQQQPAPATPVEQPQPASATPVEKPQQAPAQIGRAHV